MTGDKKNRWGSTTYKYLSLIGVVSLAIGIFIPKDSIWILIPIIGVAIGFGGAEIMWDWEWSDQEMKKRRQKRLADSAQEKPKVQPKVPESNSSPG